MARVSSDGWQVSNLADGQKMLGHAPDFFGCANDFQADPVPTPERCALLQPVSRFDDAPAVTACRSDGRCNCSNNAGFRANALFAAYVMMGCQTPGAEVLLPNG